MNERKMIERKKEKWERERRKEGGKRNRRGRKEVREKEKIEKTNKNEKPVYLLRKKMISLDVGLVMCLHLWYTF